MVVKDEKNVDANKNGHPVEHKTVVGAGDVNVKVEIKEEVSDVKEETERKEKKASTPARKKVVSS